MGPYIDGLFQKMAFFCHKSVNIKILLKNLESSDSDGFGTVSKNGLAQLKVEEKITAKFDIPLVWVHILVVYFIKLNFYAAKSVNIKILLKNLESSDSDGFRTVSKSDLAQFKMEK